MSRYALPLSRYENASVWGYDQRGMTYYAQLWRNESDSWGDPDIWISGMNPITSPEELAGIIAARTKVPVTEAAKAMGAAQTAPEVARLLEFAETAGR